MMFLYAFSPYKQLTGIIISALYGIIMYKWVKTQYTIRNKTLIIASGFVRGHVPVASIKRIEYTANYDSSAALAYEKIKIISESNGWNKEWLIAPEEVSSFVNQLTDINPRIEVSQQVKEYLVFGRSSTLYNS